jgi:hypothetical protein
VNEMIVREDARGAGVVQMQLFAATGRADFYARHGFVPRPTDAPGMDLPTAT